MTESDKKDLEVFKQFETWLLNTNLPNRNVGSPNSYIRGWHDCLNDIVNKLYRLREVGAEDNND